MADNLARAAAVRKYLARYAEPEHHAATALTGTYSAVLILPAFAESPELLNQVRAALQNSGAEKALLILVLNAPPQADAKSLSLNAMLREAVQALGPERLLDPHCRLIRHSDFDVLLVERATPLPQRQGVGLARKIGNDLALALISQGQVRLPVLFNTDADAELPPDYFERPQVQQSISTNEIERARQRAAWVYPFRHIPSTDEHITHATELYELWLRYYVEGLRYAGSPYAVHTIGSILAIDAHAYAQVRGFPRRAAGEDFHLLNKLGKVGALEQLDGPELQLLSRTSTRVPFGTGPKVSELAEHLRHPSPPTELVQAPQLEFYPARTFSALKAWLEALRRYSVQRDWEQLENSLHHADGGASILEALKQLKVNNAQRDLRHISDRTAVIEERWMTWFDGLKTLRFIHALRDNKLECRDYAHTLEAAPFFNGTTESIGQALQSLRERQNGYVVGVPPTSRA